MVIKDIISLLGGGLFKQAKELVSEIVTDKDKRAEIEAKLTQLEADTQLKLIEFETQDRDSARQRERELLKLGKHDWFMYLVGVTGLGVFGFMIWALVYKNIPPGTKELFIHGLGIVEGLVVSIFSYYFGSSRGSSSKSEVIHQSLKGK